MQQNVVFLPDGNLAVGGHMLTRSEFFRRILDAVTSLGGNAGSYVAAAEEAKIKGIPRTNPRPTEDPGAKLIVTLHRMERLEGEISLTMHMARVVQIMDNHWEQFDAGQKRLAGGSSEDAVYG